MLFHLLSYVVSIHGAFLLLDSLCLTHIALISGILWLVLLLYSTALGYRFNIFSYMFILILTFSLYLFFLFYVPFLISNRLPDTGILVIPPGSCFHSLPGE